MMYLDEFVFILVLCKITLKNFGIFNFKKRLDFVQEIDCFRYTLGPRSSRAEQAAILKGQNSTKLSRRSSSVDDINSDIKVESFEVSRKGDCMIVCLSDGRLLLYVLPNLLTPAQFEGLFSYMDEQHGLESEHKSASASILSLAGFGKNLLKIGSKIKKLV